MSYPKFNPEAKIPEKALIRLPQIIGDPEAEPPIPALIPISRSAWLEGVRKGKYPKPHKLGTRTSCWRVQDIQAVIDGTFKAEEPSKSVGGDL